MADTSGVGATSGTSANAAASGTSSRTMIAQNFDTFLQLLTTQLKNQNPLDPLDTNQFTQQLVQFASVEQQISTNTNLATLISLQQNSQLNAALGFVGQTVDRLDFPARAGERIRPWRPSPAIPPSPADRAAFPAPATRMPKELRPARTAG